MKNSGCVNRKYYSEEPFARAILTAFLIIAALTSVFAHFTSPAAVSASETAYDDPQESYLAYIVLEQDSGQTLYTQNALAPCDASLISKLMCAVVVSEYSVDGKKILVTDSVVPTENSVSGDGKYRLYAGTGYTVGNLLRAMLLGGADNCARALASYVNPNSEYFVTLMNQTASKLEMKDTYFTSPDGAQNSLARTTVSDMAKLYSYALKNSSIRNIIQSEFSHIWNNTAVFNLCTLPFSLKNTYGTATAGGLFQSGGEMTPGTMAVNITLPQSSGGDMQMKLLVIVQDSVSDDQLNTLARSLIADCYGEFRKSKAFSAGGQIARYDISGQSLSVVAESDVYLVLPVDVTPAAYIQSVTYSFIDANSKAPDKAVEALSLPVNEGQSLGTATLLLRDGSTHIVRISAGNTIQTNNARINTFLNMINTYRPLFIIILILLAVDVFIAAVVIVSKIRSKTEKKRLSGK